MHRLGLGGERDGRRASTRCRGRCSLPRSLITIGEVHNRHLTLFAQERGTYRVWKARLCCSSLRKVTCSWLRTKQHKKLRSKIGKMILSKGTKDMSCCEGNRTLINRSPKYPISSCMSYVMNFQAATSHPESKQVLAEDTSLAISETKTRKPYILSYIVAKLMDEIKPALYP